MEMCRHGRSEVFSGKPVQVSVIQRNIPYGLGLNGWMVRGSNPCGGDIFCTRPDRPWGTPSLLYNGYPGLFRGGKAAGAWC